MLYDFQTHIIGQQVGQIFEESYIRYIRMGDKQAEEKREIYL